LSWSRVSFWQKWVPGICLKNKCGSCGGLTTLPPSCADRLKILGASTSWSPRGLFRHVQGCLLHSVVTWATGETELALLSFSWGP
jgi:hypothetical protein